MSEFTRSFDWYGPSEDPNDEQFGDVVEPTELADADRYDAVLVGEPVDQAVIGRPGAAKAPKALRNALAAVKTHHFEHGPVGRAAASGDERTAAIGDLGDLVVLDRLEEMTEPSVGGIQHRVSEVTAQVHDADALCVFLGGDNSLTYPNVEPLLEGGSVGVVNCDAHLDVREVGEEPTSGTPYRQLFDAGLDGYACLGARDFETSTAYADYVHDQGGVVLSADAVARDPDEAAARALAGLGHVDHVYVSVDLDVLDAAHAPGVSAPTPGGLSTRELFRVVRRLLADDRVRGFEVVECAPPLDRDDLTVRAGARTVAHALSSYRAAAAPAGGDGR